MADIFDKLIAEKRDQLLAAKAARHKLSETPTWHMQQAGMPISAVNAANDPLFDTEINTRYQGLRELNATVDSLIDYGISDGIFDPANPDILPNLMDTAVENIRKDSTFADKHGLKDFEKAYYKYAYGYDLATESQEDLEKARLDREAHFKLADVQAQEAIERYKEAVKNSTKTIIVDDGETHHKIAIPDMLSIDDAKTLAKSNITNPLGVGVTAAVTKALPDEPVYATDINIAEALQLPEAAKHIARFNALVRDGDASLQDTYVPFTVDSTGTVGVNVAAYRQLFTAYYADIILKEKNRKLFDLSPEEQKQLTIDARERAQTRVAKIQNAAQKTIFVDIDPDDTNAAIVSGTDNWLLSSVRDAPIAGIPLLKQQAWGIKKVADDALGEDNIVSDIIDSAGNLLTKATSPFLATLYPIAYESEEGVTVGPRVRESNEHPLSQFLRISVGVPVTSYLFNSDVDWNEWGSEDHIRHIRRGEEIISHMPVIYEKLKNLTEPIPGGTDIALTGAGLATLGMILYDPDLITLTTLNVGKVIKAVKGAGEVATAMHRMRNVDRALEALKKGEQYEKVIADLRRSATPEIADLLEVEVSVRLGIPAKVSAQADKLESLLPEVAKQVSEISTKLDDAVTAEKLSRADADATLSNIKYLFDLKQTLLKRQTVLQQRLNLVTTNFKIAAGKLYTGSDAVDDILKAAATFVRQYENAVDTLKTNKVLHAKAAKELLTHSAAAVKGGDATARMIALKQVKAANKKIEAAQRVIATLTPVVGHNMKRLQIARIITEKDVVARGLVYTDKLIAKQSKVLRAIGADIDDNIIEVVKLNEKFLVADERLRFIKNIRPTTIAAAKAINESLMHIAGKVPTPDDMIMARAEAIKRAWANPDIFYKVLPSEPATWYIYAGILKNRLMRQFGAAWTFFKGKWSKVVETEMRKFVELTTVARSELSELTMNSEKPLDDIVSYLTSTTPLKTTRGNTVINMSDTERTLFERFLDYVIYDARDLKDNEALNAVLHAFIPPGRTGLDLIPGLRIKALAWLKSAAPGDDQAKTLVAFIKYMQSLTGVKYATNEAYNRVLSFVAYGIVDGALKMDFYKNMGKVIGPQLSPELVNVAFRGGETAAGKVDLSPKVATAPVNPPPVTESVDDIISDTVTAAQTGKPFPYTDATTVDSIKLRAEQVVAEGNTYEILELVLQHNKAFIVKLADDLSANKITIEEGRSLLADEAKRIIAGLDDDQLVSAVDVSIKEESVGLTVDVEGLVDLLGPTLYKDNAVHVCVKELLQNAVAAIKGRGGKGTVDIKINYTDKTLDVIDDGIGMSPEVIKENFLTIANAYKPVAETAGGSPPPGGFGLAKMIFLIVGSRVEITSVHNGIKSVIDTNNRELLKGTTQLKTFTTTEANGTHIRITYGRKINIGKGSKLHELDFMTHNNSLPMINHPADPNITLNYTVAGEGINNIYTKRNVYVIPFKEGTPVKTFEIAGDTYVLSYLDDYNSYDIDIYFNDIKEFGLPAYRLKLPAWAEGRYRLSIVSHKKAHDPEYPMDIGRETFNTKTQSEIYNNIIGVFAKLKNESERKAIDELMDIRQSRTARGGQQIDTIDNSNFVELINDTYAEMPETRRNMLATRTEIINKVSDLLNSLFAEITNDSDDVLSQLRRTLPKLFDEDYRTGVFFEANNRGYHFSYPDRAIYVNPMNMPLNSEGFAISFMATFVHELVHVAVGPHSDDFVIIEGRIFKILGETEYWEDFYRRAKAVGRELSGLPETRELHYFWDEMQSTHKLAPVVDLNKFTGAPNDLTTASKVVSAIVTGKSTSANVTGASKASPTGKPVTSGSVPKTGKDKAPRDFTQIPRHIPEGSIDALQQLYKELDVWGTDILIKYSPDMPHAPNMEKLMLKVTNHPDAVGAIPQAIVDALNREIDGYIKEMTPWANRPSPYELGLRYWKRFNVLLRTSLVTGLVIPRVGAWVTDTIGTFASMWFENGFTYASRGIVQNTVQQIPVLGPAIARRAGKYTTPPYLLEVMVNPDLHKIMTQSDTAVRISPYNINRPLWDNYTAAQIYREAASRGILTHIISEDLMQLNQRSINKAANVYGIKHKGLYAQFRKAWLDHYDYAQRLRNMQVYMEMVYKHKGDLDKAARETLRVTYDWRLAASEWERATFGVLATFYVFSKIQVMQIAKAFADPLLRPDTINYKAMDYLTGNTKIGRLKAAARITAGIPELAQYTREPGPGNEPVDDATQYDEALMRRLGWWQNNKLILDVKEMSIPQQRWFEEHNKPSTHLITTIPSLSTLEGMYTFSLLTQLMWGATLQATGGNITTSADAPYLIINEVTKRLSPVFQPMADKMVQGMSNNPFDNPLGETVRINEQHAISSMDAALTKLGFDNFSTKDEHGKLKAPSWVLAFLRGMPVVNEMTNIWHGVMNPAYTEGYAAYIGYMFKHFTGILKESPLAPKEDIDFSVKEMKDRMLDKRLELKNKAAR